MRPQEENYSQINNQKSSDNKTLLNWVGMILATTALMAIVAAVFIGFDFQFIENFGIDQLDGKETDTEYRNRMGIVASIAGGGLALFGGAAAAFAASSRSNGTDQQPTIQQEQELAQNKAQQQEAVISTEHSSRFADRAQESHSDRATARAEETQSTTGRG